MEVLLFILVAYGISNIVVFGSIFESCMMCFPTWAGIFLSLGAHLTGFTQFSPFAHYGLEMAPLAIFLDGCLASGCVWLIHTLQEHFEV
jgi:hypothetical protein